MVSSGSTLDAVTFGIGCLGVGGLGFRMLRGWGSVFAVAATLVSNSGVTCHWCNIQTNDAYPDTLVPSSVSQNLSHISYSLNSLKGVI